MEECRDRGESNFLYKTRLQSTKTIFKKENGRDNEEKRNQVYSNQIFKWKKKMQKLKPKLRVAEREQTTDITGTVQKNIRKKILKGQKVFT